MTASGAVVAWAMRGMQCSPRKEQSRAAAAAAAPVYARGIDEQVDDQRERQGRCVLVLLLVLVPVPVLGAVSGMNCW